MIRMRLRSVQLLLLVAVLGLALGGALIDRPRTVVQAPLFVPEKRGWNADVSISRRGRALNGFRPSVVVSDGDQRRTFSGREIGPGLYRVHVTFPHPGAYTYRIVVPGAGGGSGFIFAR